MKQYHEHLQQILDNGSWKAPAREGMPRSISLFGYQNRYDLQKGFPILTTKKVNFKHIVTELLWFLKGNTNIKYLVDNGCNIWNEDAYNYYKKLHKDKECIGFDVFIDLIRLSNNIKTTSRTLAHSLVENYTLGDCGKQYGWLWRNWENYQYPAHSGLGALKQNFPIDQLQQVIQSIKSNPEGRRHIVTAWNPTTLDDMALNACHAFVQFNCRALSLYEKTEWIAKQGSGAEYNANVPQYYLDCQLYQRSADMFLGVPYNISSYALLTHIIAKISNMEVGHFIHSFGDSHIYENHLDQVNELLSRDTEKYKLPTLQIARSQKDWELIGTKGSFESISPVDFELIGYESYPAIKAPLSTGLK